MRRRGKGKEGGKGNRNWRHWYGYILMRKADLGDLEGMMYDRYIYGTGSSLDASR